MLLLILLVILALVFAVIKYSVWIALYIGMGLIVIAVLKRIIMWISGR